MVEGPVTGRRFKRSTIRNASIIGGCVVALLVVIFGGTFTVQNISEKAGEKTQGILQEAAMQSSEKVASRIDTIQKQLDALAQEETILALFNEGDITALENEAEQKKTVFDSSLKLRLLLPGKYETDREATPPLSFASIDLLRRAEKWSDGDCGG